MENIENIIEKSFLNVDYKSYIKYKNNISGLSTFISSIKVSDLLASTFTASIIVYFSERVFNFLKKHKIEPVICTQRHRWFWDGGVHCLTQDLYREGEQHDYFS